MLFPEFKNLFAVNKTVCVPLEPTENTLKHVHEVTENWTRGKRTVTERPDNEKPFKTTDITDADKEIRESLSIVQDYMDDIYRKIISDTLDKMVGSNAITNAARITTEFLRFQEKHKGDKTMREEFKAFGDRASNARMDAASVISDVMASHSDCDGATHRPAAFFDEVLIPKTRKAVDKKQKTLKDAVDRLSTMKQIIEPFMAIRAVTIVGYKEGSVIYRTIFENLVTFCKNIVAWERMELQYPGLDAELEKALDALPDERPSRDEVLSPEAFVNYMSQAGIDRYNAVVNGYTDRNGVHYKGIRSVLNEYATREGKGVKKEGARKNLPPIKKLDKQILSPETGISYKPTPFASEEEIWNTIEAFRSAIHDGHVAERGRELFLNIDDYDADAITISERNASFLGHVLYRDWKLFHSGLSKLADERFPKNKEQRESFLKRKCHTLADVRAAFALEGVEPLMDTFVKKYSEYMLLLENGLSGAQGVRDKHKDLFEDKSENGNLRRAFDDILKGCRLMACFDAKDDTQTDMQFYYDLHDILDVWGRVYPLMNGTRNYCTRKFEKSDKWRMWFFNDSILGGFSEGIDFKNIFAKGGMIIRRDGKYQLVVLRRGTRIGKDLFTVDPGDETCERMSVNKGKDPAMMIPKVLFSENALTTYGASGQVRRAVAEKTYTGPAANADDLRAVIGYCYACFDEHLSFKKFGFPKRDAASFRNWREFTEFLSRYTYVNDFVQMSATKIDALDRDGLAYVFTLTGEALTNIYRGRYTRSVLVRNLVDAICGTNDTRIAASRIYYRPQLIKEWHGHKPGSLLLDKRTTDGRTLPAAIRTEIWRAIDHDKQCEDPRDCVRREGLTQEALKWLPYVKLHRATFELTKNRRYMKEHFELQVSLTLGAGNDTPANVQEALNGLVDNWLENNPGRPVVGINRGENNLIYATLVDTEGRVLEQRSFNVIGGIDYQMRIDDRAKEMEQLVRDWKSPDTIMNLKEGYLSAAVSEIARMAFENEAVIAMEDLGQQFLRDRTPLRGGIYRKFQEMLVNKLRWYVPDKHNPNEVWQLTAGVGVKKKAANLTFPHRNGIVFFVSPWAVSSTDPRTGFRFQIPVYDDKMKAEAKRDVLSRMKDIRKNAHGDWEFTFNYRDYEKIPIKGPDADWTVTSKGTRMERSGNSQGKPVVTEVRPTAIIDEVFPDAKKGESVMPLIDGLGGERLDKMIRGLRLTVQMRNCDVGAHLDRFVSPVEGGLDTDAALPGEPTCTDGVTACNVARKAQLAIARHLDEIPNEMWLESQFRC